MMRLIGRFRLAAALFAGTLATSQDKALAQAHHLAGGAGLLGGNAAMAGVGTAAMVHQAHMLQVFDRNGDGIIDPTEAALAQSGLGTLLGHHKGGAATSGGSSNLLQHFDQNGNGQIDQVERELLQLMMLAFAGYNQRGPATGMVPGVMPGQFPPAQQGQFQQGAGQQGPFQQPAIPKAKKKKRGQRVADFAKPKKGFNEAIPAPVLPKQKAKARGPMVENAEQANQPAGNQP